MKPKQFYLTWKHGKNHILPTEWIQTTSTVLRKANATSRKLETSIRTGKSRMFFRTRLKWVLRSKDTKSYCDQLRSYTQMLNTLQGSIHWYVAKLKDRGVFLIVTGKVASAWRQ